MAAKEKEKDEITIEAPNGLTRDYKFHPHDTVKKTLDHAVADFAKDGVLDKAVPYILVSGTSTLEPGLTLEQAGVGAGMKLKIRSKQVPGDGHAPSLR